MVLGIFHQHRPNLDPTGERVLGMEWRFDKIPVGFRREEQRDGDDTHGGDQQRAIGRIIAQIEPAAGDREGQDTGRGLGVGAVKIIKRRRNDAPPHQARQLPRIEQKQQNRDGAGRAGKVLLQHYPAPRPDDAGVGEIVHLMDAERRKRDRRHVTGDQNSGQRQAHDPEGAVISHLPCDHEDRPHQDRGKQQASQRYTGHARPTEAEPAPGQRDDQDEGQGEQPVGLAQRARRPCRHQRAAEIDELPHRIAFARKWRRLVVEIGAQQREDEDDQGHHDRRARFLGHDPSRTGAHRLTIGYVCSNHRAPPLATGGGLTSARVLLALSAGTLCAAACMPE